MTESEKICNEIGAKFFCKDYVYENLKYRNNSNNKVELCDGLFEYAGTYVALQIKERSKNKGSKSENVWLKEIVYEEAVEQIKETIKAINTNNIKVNDFYHQTVDLHKDYLIYPIIIFDNHLIKEYKHIISAEKTNINIFSLQDYDAMMNVLIHPYDIIYYLHERANWIKSNNLPHFVIGENKTTTILANINNENDFAKFFIHYIYDGKYNKQEDALKLLAIISKFRDKQTKKTANYKTILNILQLIEPKEATEFMGRFNYAWNKAHQNIFDITKSIQILEGDKKIDIIFCSIGINPLIDNRYYQIIFDAKQLQHKSNAAVIISFMGLKEEECFIEWVYCEKEYIPETKLLECYQKFGMYNGTITKDFFEEICSGIIK